MYTYSGERKKSIGAAKMSVPCRLLVTWERADLLAVVFVVFCHFPKCVLDHIRIKGEVGAVKNSK